MNKIIKTILSAIYLHSNIDYLVSKIDNVNIRYESAISRLDFVIEFHRFTAESELKSINGVEIVGTSGYVDLYHNNVRADHRTGHSNRVIVHNIFTPEQLEVLKF